MHKQRLLKLASLLEADAKNNKGIHFDFYTWGVVSDSSAPLSCGTRACAMGLAALSGAFHRQGLRCRIIKRTQRVEISLGVTKNPIRAAARLFQISEARAAYLFASSWDLPEHYGAEAERGVAKRIRAFVAGRAP